MSNSEEISITLSSVQIEQVMQYAGRNQSGTVANLLLAALDHGHLPPHGNGYQHTTLHQASQEALSAALTDPQLSQSLLRGLSILSCYGPDRPWRAIVELAEQLHMSPSTTHRYVKTLRAVGLLEQNPSTREYRPVAVQQIPIAV
jgi:DNA-binding MarR family transcriptional regulator